MKISVNKFSIIILLLVTVGFSYSCRIKKQAGSASITKQRIQLQYIPTLLHESYLGMPFSDFKKARMVLPDKDSNPNDFRIEYNEQIEGNDIKKLTYYFDKDNNQPLYEYIIEYRSQAKLQELMKQKYGKCNDGSQWIFDSGEGFLIRVWTSDSKLCIVGLIKDTEWLNEK